MKLYLFTLSGVKSWYIKYPVTFDVHLQKEYDIKEDKSFLYLSFSKRKIKLPFDFVFLFVGSVTASLWS